MLSEGYSSIPESILGLSEGESCVFQKQRGRETGCGGRLKGGAGLLFTEDSSMSIRAMLFPTDNSSESISAMLFLTDNSPASICAGHVKRVHAMLLQTNRHEL